MDQLIVRPGRAVNRGFIGVGYHASFPVHHRQTSARIEKLLHKRWRECRPSFTRVKHVWTGDLEHTARQIRMMKQCRTLVYLTTWDPPACSTPPQLRRYAEKVAGLLEKLVIRRGLDNIRWYCMTNELSLPSESGWGGMYADLPRFARFHRAIHAAFRKRGLPVSLLATDASPIQRWDSIAWAARTMPQVTGAYGGHHYINEHVPGDLAFYPWFYALVKKSTAVAHRQGKPFIMGEFGPRQHFGPRFGFAKWDGCAYFDTAAETLAALQTAEAVMAAVNAGADAIGYWTFTDYPDSYSPKRTYANKWGTFRWDGRDFKRRPVYYVMGLLARFFRGPAVVYKVRSTDQGLRSLALRHKETGRLSTAILNWKPVTATVRLSLPRCSGGNLYLFDAQDTTRYARNRDLLAATFWRRIRGPVRNLEIPPRCLVVLAEKPR